MAKNREDKSRCLRLSSGPAQSSLDRAIAENRKRLNLGAQQAAKKILLSKELKSNKQIHEENIINKVESALKILSIDDKNIISSPEFKRVQDAAEYIDRLINVMNRNEPAETKNLRKIVNSDETTRVSFISIEVDDYLKPAIDSFNKKFKK